MRGGSLINKDVHKVNREGEGSTERIIEDNNNEASTDGNDKDLVDKMKNLGLKPFSFKNAQQMAKQLMEQENEEDQGQ